MTPLRSITAVACIAPSPSTTAAATAAATTATGSPRLRATAAAARVSYSYGGYASADDIGAWTDTASEASPSPRRPRAPRHTTTMPAIDLSGDTTTTTAAAAAATARSRFPYAKLKPRSQFHIINAPYIPTGRKRRPLYEARHDTAAAAAAASDSELHTTDAQGPNLHTDRRARRRRRRRYWWEESMTPERARRARARPRAAAVG